MSRTCDHCLKSIDIRNPSGFCDHLNFPDNCEVCRSKAEADIEERWADEYFKNWQEAEKELATARETIKLSDELAKADQCPNCPNQGYFVLPSHLTGEPEQVQCQWCYETPNSFFNAKAAYEKARGLK